MSTCHGEKTREVAKIVLTTGYERGRRFDLEFVSQALLTGQVAWCQVYDVLRDGDLAGVFVDGAVDDLVVHGGYIGQLTRVVAWLKY